MRQSNRSPFLLTGVQIECPWDIRHGGHGGHGGPFGPIWGAFEEARRKQLHRRQDRPGGIRRLAEWWWRVMTVMGVGVLWPKNGWWLLIIVNGYYLLMMVDDIVDLVISVMSNTKNPSLAEKIANRFLCWPTAFLFFQPWLESKPAQMPTPINLLDLTFHDFAVRCQIHIAFWLAVSPDSSTL